MKQYLLLILVIVVFVSGIFVGYSIFKPQIVKEQVNSQTILQTLRSEGFLVTQTYILNQKVTIDKNTGTMWKDFFWGQSIEASAVLKVSSGVDLTKLTENDILIGNKEITVTLPQVQIQSTELISDIELRNTQGILKKIFNDDDGYNLALSKLKEQAQLSAQQDSLLREAQTNTQKEIQRLMRLAAQDWNVKVEFK
ncbi:MAG: DUF4230 domain-containing protein [Candidatus Parcubacteria bacterium]|nr:DUF4230 domain-containing protein [Candidatus Parcubacteria bacterium]